MTELSSSWKTRGIAIGIGIVFMVLALILQSITQAIPSLLIIFKYGTSSGTVALGNFELSNPIIWALFIGGTAAVYQESFKYFSVNTQSKYFAIWIGLGFAFVDVGVILFDLLFYRRAGIQKTVLVLSILNVVSSLLFHPGTALILKYGRTIERGFYFLLFTILLHGIEDGGLVFTDLYVLVHRSAYEKAIIIFWVVAMVVSITAFVLGMFFRRSLYAREMDEHHI